jgi:hypothetical protein
MGPDFRTWESITLASGTALLLYLVVNYAIGHTGLEQVAPELLGAASGLLGVTTGAVGFFLVLRWTRRDRA